MANPVCEVLVTEAQLRAPPIDVDPSAGAAVEFWGIVRGSEDGREIDGIEYEAHREMAEHQLKGIAAQVLEKFGLTLVIIHHRIGFIPVGEPSLFVRVCSCHRKEGFLASQWVVEELSKKCRFGNGPPSPRLRRGRPR